MKVNNYISNLSPNLVNDNQKTQQSALDKIALVNDIKQEDKANATIANSLQVQTSALSQGLQNANESIGVLQTASSVLDSLKTNVQNLETLAIKNNNPTLSSSQQEMIQNDFQATLNSMRNTLNNSTYGNQNLFDRLREMGIEGELSLEDINLQDESSINKLSNAISDLSSSVGSQMNEQTVSVTNSLSAISNLTASKSFIEETDFNQKTEELNKASIQTDIASLVNSHQKESLQKSINIILGG
jgi:flagellin